MQSCSNELFSKISKPKMSRQPMMLTDVLMAPTMLSLTRWMSQSNIFE
jgi:hypothetical protein